MERVELGVGLRVDLTLTFLAADILCLSLIVKAADGPQRRNSKSSNLLSGCTGRINIAAHL